MAVRANLSEIPNMECLATSAGTLWAGLFVAKHRCGAHKPLKEFATDQPQVLLITGGEPRSRWTARGTYHTSHWRPGATILLDSDYPLRDIEFESPREGIIISLDADKAAQWLNEERRPTLQPHVINEDPQIKALAECMIWEICDGCPSGTLFAESISLALLTHIDARYATEAVRGRIGNGLTSRKLRKIREYVEENLASGIKLSDLANIAELSPRHFCRSFKVATGTTPYRYVLQRRIARAKVYLSVGKFSVTEIAFRLGFSSHSHFSYCFQKEVGVSPRKYEQRRRRH
jgi:AraC family transcriptional regulator